MEFFASDAMNGRGSGTRDEWITATYIASHLRRWGLEPLGDDGGLRADDRHRAARARVAARLTVGTSRFTHGKEITVGA